MAEGRSGLLHATTGSGKTLAIAFGAWLASSETADADDAIRVLWITPMRALAADTERSLREAFAGVEDRSRLSAVADRRPHRRHVGKRARGADEKASAPSRDNARKPLAHAHSGARAGDVRFARFRRRRRMARAYGQQARRADGACARSPSSFSPWPRDLGPLGDDRQSRRGEARASRASRRGARRAGRRTDRQAADHRHASAEVAGALSVGGSPRRENGRAGRRRDRSRDDDARLHQHAVSGGTLVSAYSSPPAGMGRSSCDPSRLVVA